ncbi:hypothetical protein OUZ56_010662 [Daphnia magna]|uniref:CxC3 like cysteine cluster domain-containing protein n=1 Tax=Daphnia magna TaxID=35525 RepID=A0ABR0AJ66_9CRUS|nr:hypothetical protein OUZ56_010662 [Daphnia magna]
MDSEDQSMVTQLDYMPARILLPREVVKEDGAVFERDVPAPCKVPRSCLSCNKIGTCSVCATTKCIAVVIKAGCFDLNIPKFYCTACQVVAEATTEDYIFSGWWKGFPKA